MELGLQNFKQDSEFHAKSLLNSSVKSDHF